MRTSNRWLLCDYGEVLSVAPPDDDWRALHHAALPAAGPDDFHRIYWEHRPPYDRGDLSAADYWERVRDEPVGGDLLADLIGLDQATWIHPNQASVDAAVAAAGRGYRLAILSNAPLEIADAIAARPWLEPFEPKLFSCHLGEIKPNPGIYTDVLMRLSASGSDVVFFDDRPTNVDAAVAAGIDGRLFQHPSQFEDL